MLHTFSQGYIVSKHWGSDKKIILNHRQALRLSLLLFSHTQKDTCEEFKVLGVKLFESMLGNCWPSLAALIWANHFTTL